MELANRRHNTFVKAAVELGQKNKIRNKNKVYYLFKKYNKTQGGKSLNKGREAVGRTTKFKCLGIFLVKIMSKINARMAASNVYYYIF